MKEKTVTFQVSNSKR